MNDQFFIYLAIGIYFLVLIGIGVAAYLRTSDHEGYMLANRGLPGWVAALSAGASDMSGWLIMGLPGAIYVAGLIEAWTAIGLTIGAFVNWLIVAPRLRAYSQVSRNSITLPSFFENRTRDSSRVLRIVSSVIVLVFFTLYVSSGMVAGGVFFESSFEADYLTGMLIVAAVTLLYTLFGGFLGASLTDVVQGLMMFIALIIVPIFAVISVGGWGEAVSLINTLEPNHLSFSGGGLTTASIIVIASGIGWGLGYFGQPHIVVRFMALRAPSDAKQARRVGLAWQAISMAGTVFAGLIGVAWVHQNNVDLADPETIVLLMSQALLHPLFAGFVLAAVLAAIMSTFSSQLIVCSSALVEDIYKVVRKDPPSDRRLVLMGRGAVLLVAIIAGLLALNPNGTILELVGFAWAGFGAAFGPLVLLSLYYRKLTNWGALSGMVVGAVVVFVWAELTGGIFDLYEIVPGFILSLLVALIVSAVTYKPNPEVEQEFERAAYLAKNRKAFDELMASEKVTANA
ncbi:sodium/proline symporter PutP [Auritidibacter ignavus]|uniref:sodium/proline symporter PutP n=1 Tax=Auritidibacter ignavus TaxID=678932 RepID=UPI00244C3202|nr:sodium/proline symporter PutP [Auritidibacter ignavus]WGH90538.1 sodium/proline symporter PutP [Auritidibacter ignavus]